MFWPYIVGINAISFGIIIFLDLFSLFGTKRRPIVPGDEHKKWGLSEVNVEIAWIRFLFYLAILLFNICSMFLNTPIPLIIFFWVSFLAMFGTEIWSFKSRRLRNIGLRTTRAVIDIAIIIVILIIPFFYSTEIHAALFPR